MRVIGFQPEIMLDDDNIAITAHPGGFFSPRHRRHSGWGCHGQRPSRYRCAFFGAPADGGGGAFHRARSGAHGWPQGARLANVPTRADTLAPCSAFPARCWRAKYPGWQPSTQRSRPKSGAATRFASLRLAAQDGGSGRARHWQNGTPAPAARSPNPAHLPNWLKMTWLRSFSSSFSSASICAWFWVCSVETFCACKSCPTSFMATSR